MSKITKTLAKMKSNPRDWRIEQIETIGEQYGFNVRKTGGSHFVFVHELLEEQLTVPSRRPIKPIYVKKFVALIEQLEKDNEDT